MWKLSNPLGTWRCTKAGRSPYRSNFIFALVWSRSLKLYHQPTFLVLYCSSPGTYLFVNHVVFIFVHYALIAHLPLNPSTDPTSLGVRVRSILLLKWPAELCRPLGAFIAISCHWSIDTRGQHGVWQTCYDWKRQAKRSINFRLGMWQLWQIFRGASSERWRRLFLAGRWPWSSLFLRNRTACRNRW